MHAPSSKMMDRYTIAGVAPRLKLAVGAFNRAVKSPKRLAETAGSAAAENEKTA